MGEHIGVFIPWYNVLHNETRNSLSYALAPGSPHTLFAMDCGHESRLTMNFNRCWRLALDKKDPPLTRFVMLHADVWPVTPGWVDVMEAERARTGADVLSVVLPVKAQDFSQPSSTMLENWRTGQARRLTIAETLANTLRTPTFDAADLGHPDCRLLMSTGLWIADFTKPWREKVWFEVRDRIVRRPDGTHTEEQVEEAWTFSHKLYDLGLTIKASHCVSARHIGECGFPNDQPGATAAEQPWERSMW